MPPGLHSHIQEPSIGILIHRFYSHQWPTAPAPGRVQIHLLHPPTPVGAHVRVRDSAREVEVGVRIVVRKPGDARLEGRVVPLGKPIVGVRRVGGAPSTHGTVGPWLGHDPIHDFAEIQRLVSSPVVGPNPERSTGTPGVAPDHSIPLAGEELLAEVGSVAFPGPPITGHGEDGGDLRPLGKALGKHHVQSDADTVPHGHIQGSDRSDLVGPFDGLSAGAELVCGLGLGPVIHRWSRAGGDGQSKNQASGGSEWVDQRRNSVHFTFQASRISASRSAVSGNRTFSRRSGGTRSDSHQSLTSRWVSASALNFNP